MGFGFPRLFLDAVFTFFAAKLRGGSRDLGVGEFFAELKVKTENQRKTIFPCKKLCFFLVLE